MLAERAHQRLSDIFQVILNGSGAEVVDDEAVRAHGGPLHLLPGAARNEEERDLRSAQPRRQA